MLGQFFLVIGQTMLSTHTKITNYIITMSNYNVFPQGSLKLSQQFNNVVYDPQNTDEPRVIFFPHLLQIHTQ